MLSVNAFIMLKNYSKYPFETIVGSLVILLATCTVDNKNIIALEIIRAKILIFNAVL